MKRKSVFILIICIVILIITGIEINEKYPEKIEDNTIDIVDDKLDNEAIDEDLNIKIFDDKTEESIIDENLEAKAIELFGIDYCKRSIYASKNGDDIGFEDKNHPLIAGAALTDYICKLCKVTRTNSNTAVPEICRDCALATNRCAMCGKKLINSKEKIISKKKIKLK